MKRGVGTSSATYRCEVRRFGAAYTWRVQSATCSTNVPIVEVWVRTS